MILQGFLIHYCIYIYILLYLKVVKSAVRMFNALSRVIYCQYKSYIRITYCNNLFLIFTGNARFWRIFLLEQKCCTQKTRIFCWSELVSKYLYHKILLCYLSHYHHGNDENTLKIINKKCNKDLIQNFIIPILEFSLRSF